MENCTDTHINPLCEEKFENIEKGVSEILANQQEFHDKMFVDNGARSYQTFRRTTEAFMKFHLWVYGLFCTGIILTTAGILINRAMK